MFNRRRFLAGLLAGPAAAIACEGPAPTATDERRIWVINGVNWAYNDEYSYPEGDYLTQHAFADKSSADQVCARLIEEFCEDEDPEEFVMPDIALRDDWNDWSRRQQWDWHLGCTPEPDRTADGVDDGYGWVAMPFEVREMTIPASAVRQIQAARSRS